MSNCEMLIDTMFKLKMILEKSEILRRKENLIITGSTTKYENLQTTFKLINS